MSDTTPDALEPDEVPEVEEDNRIWVLVEVESVPEGGEVEVPGLGLFENGKAKPVEEHQIALFRQQGFDLGDAEESRELHIKVPPDPEEPVDEVSFEDAFEEGDLTQDAPPPEVDDNENASEGTPSTDTTTEV
jgi:hypothetical protein